MSTAVSRGGFVSLGTSGDPLAVARWYAARRADWPQVRFDRRRRWYQRLAAGSETEVWLLSWLPGQDTDLHDHGGSAGAFLVVAGTLTERTPVLDRDGGAWGLRQGRIGADQGRAFGARHIHQVINMEAQPAVSLHVYRPALREMTRYHLTNNRLVVTALDRAGVDW
ncbi:cysteine dioxygenase [Micromonospora palythoicola]|uniref:cysteine dioxygenase n=1 Tax=Micromonospora palythoicola TaxID=3120507 RepID=UPI002FCE3B3F